MLSEWISSFLSYSLSANVCVCGSFLNRKSVFHSALLCSLYMYVLFVCVSARVLMLEWSVCRTHQFASYCWIQQEREKKRSSRKKNATNGSQSSLWLQWLVHMNELRVRFGHIESDNNNSRTNEWTSERTLWRMDVPRISYTICIQTIHIRCTRTHTQPLIRSEIVDDAGACTCQRPVLHTAHTLCVCSYSPYLLKIVHVHSP